MARGFTVRLLAATMLAVLVPAAPLAHAQPGGAGDDAPPTRSGPTPPPLGDDRGVPHDDGQPDVDYTRIPNKQCVRDTPGEVDLDEKAWGQAVLQFKELWAFATGKGQTVAVIDTGVSPHVHLGNRLLPGGDYVEAGGNGLEDCDGHGTQVAGIIAADPADPDVGFRGIAPDAKILSFRQSSSYYEYEPPEGSNERAKESAGSLKTLTKAVVAAANRGADVINMSVDSCRTANLPKGDWVAPNLPMTEDERNLQRALRYAVEDKDVVVVSSAGNIPEAACPDQNNSDPGNPEYIVTPPWFSEYVLSVAAVDHNGNPAPFSMHGPWVSVAAPGTNIISLSPASPTELVNVTADSSGDATPIQGTSFAAPYVAGLAALVRERFPELTAKQVMHRIKTTAAHPAAENGRNVQVGYGMIDPVAALTRMLPSEAGIQPDEAIDVPFQMPPPYERNWVPVQVAVIGAAGGLGLLLLTLFIVHTVRRQRRDPSDLL